MRLASALPGHSCRREDVYTLEPDKCVPRLSKIRAFHIKDSLQTGRSKSRTRGRLLSTSVSPPKALYSNGAAGLRAADLSVDMRSARGGGAGSIW